MLVTQSGCLPQLMFAALLLGGPPTVEPDFDQQTKISLSGPSKPNVLVLCYAKKEAKFDYDQIDRELSRLVAHRLNQKRIRVVNPDIVNAWLDKNADDWFKPTEIAHDIDGVDYIIYIELNDYSLYESGSHSLYRGNATGKVTVYDVENDEAPIYDKEIKLIYPTHVAKSTSEISKQEFQMHFMNRLSEEIGWLFYDRAKGDEIVHGMLY